MIELRRWIDDFIIRNSLFIALNSNIYWIHLMLILLLISACKISWEVKMRIRLSRFLRVVNIILVENIIVKSKWFSIFVSWLILSLFSWLNSTLLILIKILRIFIWCIFCRWYFLHIVALRARSLLSIITNILIRILRVLTLLCWRSSLCIIWIYVGWRWFISIMMYSFLRLSLSWLLTS